MIINQDCLKKENCNTHKFHLLPEQMFKVTHWDLSLGVQSSDQQLQKLFLFFPAFSSFSCCLLVVSLFSFFRSLLSPNWRNGAVSWNESVRWRERYLISPRRLRHLPPTLLYSTQALLAISVFCLCIPVSSAHSYKHTHTCSHTHTRTLKSVNVTNAVSVQPLLTNRQQLRRECNQTAQCQCPLPQLVLFFFLFFFDFFVIF